jgi:hypothetical protein
VLKDGTCLADKQSARAAGGVADAPMRGLLDFVSRDTPVIPVSLG